MICLPFFIKHSANWNLSITKWPHVGETKTPTLRFKVTTKVLSDQYYNYHPQAKSLHLIIIRRIRCQKFILKTPKRESIPINYTVQYLVQTNSSTVILLWSPGTHAAILYSSADHLDMSMTLFIVILNEVCGGWPDTMGIV